MLEAIKNIVSVLVSMRLTTSCAKRPRSLAKILIHISLSGPCERAWYSIEMRVCIDDGVDLMVGMIGTGYQHAVDHMHHSCSVSGVNDRLKV